MGQTTSKGEAIGWWATGGRVYQSDMLRIETGVANGKYVPYTDKIPEGFEGWIEISGPPARKYARKMNGFKLWWMKHKAGITEQIAAAAGIGLEKVQKIASIVLPILLDAGLDAAKIAATREFGDDSTVNAVIEALNHQIKAAPMGANPAAAREISGSGQSRNLYVGGVLAKFGGGDDDVDMTLLNNYVNSANSKGKKHIIDALVEVAEGLKMKVSGTTPEEKVKSIMANLPQPGQFKKETHKVACEAIAMRLNKAYGSEIVSMKLAPEVICQEVTEVLSSLASGMHSEFIAVYNDARRILRNLQILAKTLDESHTKLVAELRAGDEGSRARAANYEGIHEAIKGEINRQTAMLSGILNSTLAPVDAELGKLMRAGGIKSLIGEVSTDKVGPGTTEFSKFLAGIIKGMGVTAHFAALIENALKTVGMTMQEYASSKSTQEFRAKIAKGMSSRDMNDKQFDEYLRAAELLFDNLERREEISEVAGKSGAGGDERADVVGGADYEKSAIERRLENRRIERNLYFNTFHKEVNALFDGLLGNINVLSNKVGTEVPLSENLDQFRRCLQRVAYDDEKLLRKGMIYKALLGYFTDATAKQKKEEFINKLRMLSSSAATLAEMSMYASSRQYFTDVVAQVGAIIKLIETYSEKLAAKFGRGEVTGGDDSVTGGALDEEPKLKYKAAKSIEESIEMFDFKYRLANIKDNLKISAEETPKFFEGHENKVAISIGNFLAEEKIKYDALKAEADKLSTGPICTVAQDAALADADATKSAAVWNKQREAVVATLDEIWEAKKAFWLTIEAIDAYLREFTNGMVNSPDDIRDIRSMVENVEVIAEWYNEQSGNNLSNMFCKFPAVVDAGINTFSAAAVTYAKETAAGDHPYKNSDLAGNPLIVTDPVRGREALDLAEKTVRSFGLLKNFVSVFNKIGAKFGGEALSKKIPMTPATMYENLVRFIRASSVVQGFAELKVDKNGKIDETSHWAADDGLDSNIDINVANVNASVFSSDRAGFTVGVMRANRGPKASTIFRKRWGVWMSTIYQGDFAKRVGFGFTKENTYFVLAIKALASKLFTIINLQEIMVRPSDYSGLTTARVILGSADEIPKVEKGAVPLYLRLLLLAQFYRKLFGDKPYNAESGYKLPNHTTFRISLIPEIDGVFSEVMRLVFRKNRNIDHVAYNDDDVKEWIRAVNLVYQKTQSSKQGDTATHVIHDFVAEINRRYGIISVDDVTKSDNELKERYAHGSESYADQTADEIPILEGEGDDLPSRPSLSVRYLADTIAAKDAKKSRYQLEDDHRKILKNFRDGFEIYFQNADDEHSLGNAIHLAQVKLDTLQDDAARFRVVASLVRGVDAYNKTDSAKYLYFHENVVAGLNTLSAIHTMLARFRQVAVALDIDRIRSTLETVWSTDDSKKKPKHLGDAHGKMLEESGLVVSAENCPVDPVSIFCGGRDKDTGVTDVLFDGKSARVFDSAQNKVAAGAFASGTATDTIFSVLNGIKPADFKGLNLLTAGGNEAARKALQAYMRYGISNHYIMRVLVETLFALNDVHTNLVDVKIEDGMLYINFNNVKELVNGLFKHVSHSIELVRPYLSDDTINRYVDKLTAGSYYWLHEQLVEQMFVGRADVDNQSDKYLTLDDCAKKLSATYKHLTGKWDVIVEITGGAAKVADSTEANNRISYAHLFAEMTHYDTSKDAEIARGSHDAEGNAPPTVVDFLTNNMDMLLLSVGPDGKKQLDTRYSVRFKQLYSWTKELNFNRSALMVFNQLIAQFLQNNYDPVTAKMYAGVLKDFNQSTFNRAIIDHTYTYPDMPPALVAKFPGMLEDQLGTDGTIDFLTHARDKTLFNLVKPLFKEMANSIAVRTITSPDPVLSTLNQEQIGKGTGNPFIAICLLYLYAKIIHSAVLDAKKYLDSIAAGARAAALADNRDTIPRGAADQNSWALVLAGFAANWAAPGANKDAFAAGATLNDLLVTDMGIPIAANSVAPALDAEAAFDWVLRCAYNGGFVKFAGGVVVVPPANTTARVNLINIYLKLINQNADSILWPRMSAGMAATEMTPIFNNFPPAKPYIEFSHLVHNQSGSDAGNIGGNVYDALTLLRPNTAFDDVDSPKFDIFLRILILISHEDVVKDARLYKATVDEVKRAFINPFVIKNRGDVDVTTIVRQEDFHNFDYSKHVTSADITVSSSDKGTLFLARSDEINQGPQKVIAAGSIMRNPIPQQPPPASGVSTTARPGIIALKGRGDPDGDHVLYTSLARIINTLTSARTAAGTPYYLQENIADIPSYMKERMRANLPGFSALFHALMQRCEFLKRLLDKREINADRTDIPTTKAFTNPYPYVLVHPRGADQEIKTRFSGILDAVSKGCAAIIKSCEQTVREIGDSEVFFETYQGSIKDYKLQNMTDPLMPISSLLATFNNVIAAEHTNFLPFHSLGDDKFKFLYGARLLLHKLDKQPLLEHAPGYMQLIEAFNLMADDKFKEDKKAAEEYFKMLMTAVRFIYATKHLRGPVASSVVAGASELKTTLKPLASAHVYGSISKMDLVVGKYIEGELRNDQAVDNVYSRSMHPSLFTGPEDKMKTLSDMSIIAIKDKNGLARASYAIDRTLTEVVRLTESTAKDDRIKDIVSTIIAPKDTNDSVEMRNILDLGIVPINVHALARDIPLATLYNYGYTFDRMAVSAYNNMGAEDTRNFITGVSDGTIDIKKLDTPSKLMAALLVNPYLVLGAGLDLANIDRNSALMVHMMMAGINGDGLGRPKYISDQVFNKSLFGELYPNPSEIMFGGPAGDEHDTRDQWGTGSARQSRLTAMRSALVNLHAAVAHHVFYGDLGNLSVDDAGHIIPDRVVNVILGEHDLTYANISTELFKYVGDLGILTGTKATGWVTAIGKAIKAEFKDTKDNDAIKATLATHAFIIYMNALIARRMFELINQGSSADTAAKAAAKMMPWYTEVLRSYTHDTAGAAAHLRIFATALGLDGATPATSKTSKKDFALYVGYGAGPSDWSGRLTKELSQFADDFKEDEILPGAKTGFREPPYSDVINALKEAAKHPWRQDVITADSYKVKTSISYPESATPRKTSNKLDSMNGAVKSVELTPPHAQHLAYIGRLRFDTVLVRNIVFITNVYRTISHLLRKSLSYVGDEIARSMPAITNEMTEFIGRQVYTPHMPAKDKKHWKRFNV